MEFRMTGGYSIVKNPSPRLNYTTVLKLKASGNGAKGRLIRDINMNSWRTLTMSFLVNSNGNGYIVGIGASIQFLQEGTSVRFIWPADVINVNTVFQNVLIPDGVTPHYLILNMLSEKESRYPNAVRVYVGPYRYIDDSYLRKFTTTNYAPLYYTSYDFSLFLGYWDQNTADISVASLRLFDYELKADEYNKDQANTWQMKYIQDTKDTKDT
jgi:hypothetical protein